MNRLADTHSPYLLGHAGNPVDWWPWSDAAFAEAVRRDVPVFLSIGYATCHWCHVMEHESFRDPATAAVLNEAFVCVKVDREERPDVDAVYMAACLATLGHGGWPLTALLVPDSREPFWVGTYLPRETRGGRLGVVDLAGRVGAFWRERPEGVRETAAEIAGVVRAIGQPEAEGDTLGPADLDRVAGALLARADRRDGGFGTAPKFPTPHLVRLALRLAGRAADAGEVGRAADLARVAAHALAAMAAGGIHDHLAGGFHRYSTDRRWLLPHFEKTLYDQAGLAMAYTDAALALGHADGVAPFETTARRTLDYVLARLTAPDGTFYCGEDADSLDAAGHREEGAAYVWTPDDLAAVLGADLGAAAAALWGVRDGGNFLDEATRQPTGASILWLDPAETAAQEAARRAMADLGTTPDTVAARLLAARDRRPQPLLDDKRLADWNGLAVSALARAAAAFGEPRYLSAARRGAERLLDLFATPDGGLFHRAYVGTDGADTVGIGGMLDDYAFLAGACLDLHAATLETRWLAHALRLHGETHRRFARAGGGWYATEPAADLLVRRVDLDDGAMPSGYAQAVWNGLRLARLTGRADLEAEALAALRVPPPVRQHPSGFAYLYAAAAYALAPGREVVVAGDPHAPDTRHLLDAVQQHAHPDDAVLLVAPGDSEIATLAPFTAGMAPADGRAQAFVCRDHACALPTADADTLARQLRD